MTSRYTYTIPAITGTGTTISPVGGSWLVASRGTRTVNAHTDAMLTHIPESELDAFREWIDGLATIAPAEHAAQFAEVMSADSLAEQEGILTGWRERVAVAQLAEAARGKLERLALNRRPQEAPAATTH